MEHILNTCVTKWKWKCKGEKKAWKNIKDANYEEKEQYMKIRNRRDKKGSKKKNEIRNRKK